MQVNVPVSSAVLQWVIKNASIETLPQKIVDFLLIWSQGEKLPTFNQIEKTSKATGIPLGYFFLQTPPEENIKLLHYRTIDSLSSRRPSRELVDTIHDMDQIQDWASEYMMTEGSTPPAFVGILKNENEPIKCAHIIRQQLDLSEDWFKQSETNEESFRFIRKAISNAGVIVMMSGIVGNNTHRALAIDEFRAFASIDEYAPLIFINTNDSINGRIFSILHEFVHICFGEDDLFNDRYSNGKGVKPIETICNAVTAELLVPQRIFHNEWSAGIRDNTAIQTVERLARYFKCGSIVIARRALDCGYIKHEQYSEIAEYAIKKYNEMCERKKGQTGGDYYRTAASRIDKRFFSMLSTSVAEGRTLYSDAFRLTNTNRSTFTQLAQAQIGDRIQ